MSVGFDQTLRQVRDARRESRQHPEPPPENLADALFDPVLARVADLQGRIESEAVYRTRLGLWASLLEGSGIAPPGATPLAQARTFAKHSLLVATARILIGCLDDPAASVDSLVDRASGGFQGWLAETARGRELLGEMVEQIRGYDWRGSTKDVLKDAYHGLIDPADRKVFGEFYTPDDLARLVVEEVLDDDWCDAAIHGAARLLRNAQAATVPSNLGVLDPSCGSGTFLFHAARRLGRRIRLAHKPLLERTAEIVALLVHGVDLHPVATEMARATLSMALPQSASGRLPHLRVLLGDAMRTHEMQMNDADLFQLGQQGVGRLIGNPPWLVSPYAPEGPRKDAIEALRIDEGVQPARRTSAKGDLASVFTARTTRLYLSDQDGLNRYGWVLPGSALINDVWAPWRSGRWSGTAVRHTEAWNLDDVVPPVFPHAPNGTCVVLGRRVAPRADRIEKVLKWRGPLETAEVRELARRPSRPSLYEREFRIGALSKPQPLLLAVAVAEVAEGDGHLVEVRTKLGTKRPWKGIELTGVIEKRALLPVVRSQELEAFRVAPVRACLIAPREGDRILNLTIDEEARACFPFAFRFWERAEAIYQEKRSARAGATLADNLDYKRTLSAQLRGTGPERLKVLYNASGASLRAARLPFAQMGNEKTYWAGVASDEEALYLCGVLNARCMQDAWREGKTSKLDFHKSLWRHVPVPKYDPDSDVHRGVSRAARKLEAGDSEDGWSALDRCVAALLPDYATD